MTIIDDGTWAMLTDARRRFEALPADDPEARIISDPLPEMVARAASRRLNGEGAGTIAYLAAPGTRNRQPTWVVLFGSIPAARWGR